MSWMPPPPPLRGRESVIAYWRAILEIPSSEPSAAVLRGMASQRLAELHENTHEAVDRSLTV